MVLRSDPEQHDALERRRTRRGDLPRARAPIGLCSATTPAFNESFATFVQQEGLREWRASRRFAAADLNENAHDDAFTALVLDLRARLGAVYARGSTAADKRAGKEREIDDFRERYRRLRDSEWAGDTRYDGWVDSSINNARLAPFGLYDRWVPAFALLFTQARGEWKDFYAIVRELAGQKKEEREQRLDALLASVSPNGE